MLKEIDDSVANIKKWVVFYPIYINSKKTLAQGRRISASKGCEDPTCIEIGDCCGALKLPYAIEINKAYPRDFMQVGRVRVQLKREDGTLCNPDIKSSKDFLLFFLLLRKDMMHQVAAMVPRHPGRNKKQAAASSSSASAGASSKAGTSSKGGKGGKKKK
ncbi:hypothetical protein C5167_006286 [Papaver somniferum]|uniref:Signal recognition particle 19 kDa protein n=1 Tax=Papaver somniferum TaxID=3469 RepID=A0A4Y7JD07_PAPSO|nr:hypothetical protein C5167_006286 [Papaver somniferum]